MQNRFKTAFFLMLSLPVVVGMIQSDNVLDREVDIFGVNIFGNIISVKNEKVFLKTNNSTLQFENLSFGAISSIAADDALNIMLYYEDVQKILFLDNQLSLKRDPIDLYQLDMQSAKLSCLSYNTGFWVYNSASTALHRFDRFLNQTYATGNLSILIGKQVNPIAIKEAYNFLIMNDPSIGLIVFDRYGALLKEIYVKDILDFQINDDNVLWLRNDSVFQYHLSTFSMDTLRVSIKDAIQFSVQSNKLYYLNKDGDLVAHVLP